MEELTATLYKEDLSNPLLLGEGEVERQPLFIILPGR